jgi:hypothetical protein
MQRMILAYAANCKERKLGLSKRMDGEVVFGVGGKGGGHWLLP